MKRFAIFGIFIVALGGARVLATPHLRRPVVQFLYFYQQSDDLGPWERLVYSLLLARS